MQQQKFIKKYLELSKLANNPKSHRPKHAMNPR